jgi:hypothetical protein
VAPGKGPKGSDDGRGVPGSPATHPRSSKKKNYFSAKRYHFSATLAFHSSRVLKLKVYHFTANGLCHEVERFAWERMDEIQKSVSFFSETVLFFRGGTLPKYGLPLLQAPCHSRGGRLRARGRLGARGT